MNEKDIFKEQLKSVFNDFEAPVPHDGWEKIEQSLHAVARTKIIRRNWYIGSAAATVAILIGSLFFFNSPQSVDEALPTLVQETIADKPKTAETQEIHTAQTKPHAKSVAGSQSKTQATKRDIVLAKHTFVDETVVPAQTNKQVNETSAETKTAEVSPKTSRKTEEKTAITPPNQDEIDRLVREFAEAGQRDIFMGLEADKKDRKPMMLALNAKGGLSSSQKTVNSPMTLRSANTLADKGSDALFGGVGADNNLAAEYGSVNLAARNVANNVAEMEHAQPFSVGFTFSKTILDRLSLETGLVYTYLFSKAKNTNIDFRNLETQHFHYLGIPLNLNYNFLNVGKLALFASAGGMVEKDVYGSRKYQSQSEDDILQKTSQQWVKNKIKQENPQFSVNAGIGASYPLYGGFNLYGKVGRSYYFDAKNEYKTIYSDKKIVMDLNVGIRFDF